MSIILWIDPWTTTTWFAIIEKNKDLKILDYWVIETIEKIYEINYSKSEVIYDDY